MLDSSWPGWGLMQSGITAGAGFLGVIVGGGVAIYSQRRQKQHDRIRDQLEKLYSPLIGILLEIRAKSEVRVKLTTAGRDSWAAQFEGVQSPHIKQRIQQDLEPEYIRLFDYNNEQLLGDIVPLYQKMLAVFTEQIGLAEESTLTHYPALVEFVEIWNRFVKKSLPRDVLDKIEHKEETLTAFYADLRKQFDRLRKRLRK